MTNSTTHTPFRVRIVADFDYDPSDLDWPAEEITQHLRRFDSGELSAVGAVAEHQCASCGTWPPVRELVGIEIDTAEPFGPGDVITAADIPLGPADPLRLYGFGDRASIPPNLAVPYTASDSYLVQVAADLLTEVAADHASSAPDAT